MAMAMAIAMAMGVQQQYSFSRVKDRGNTYSKCPMQREKSGKNVRHETGNRFVQIVGLV